MDMRTDTHEYLRQLASKRRRLYEAAGVLSVPLRLDTPLAELLLSRFVPDVEATDVLEQVVEFGLGYHRGQDIWHLHDWARSYFLLKLQKNRARAVRIHTTVLEYMEGEPNPLLSGASDPDQAELVRAYLTVPLDAEEGASRYWAVYSRSRAKSRFAVLPVIATLSESQSYWLTDYVPFIHLYKAAALYYAGHSVKRQEAEAELEALLNTDELPPFVELDASYLYAILSEETDRETAIKRHQRVSEIADALRLEDEKDESLLHLRLTVAKSDIQLSIALESRGEPEDLETATHCLRRGIQVFQLYPNLEAGYETGPTRRLLEIAQKLGMQDDIQELVRRSGELEKPQRDYFLRQAIERASGEELDPGYLYYAAAAYAHRSAYDSQEVEFEIRDDGAAHITATYTLLALGFLDQTDTFLEAAPESKADQGVRFETLESLTPGIDVRFVQERQDDKARLAIGIEPPMRPGELLTIRWTAYAPPGSFDTAPGPLARAQANRGRDSLIWDIIAPIKYLKLKARLPFQQEHYDHRTWPGFSRLGSWPTAGQGPALYRAYLRDDPLEVRCWSALRPPKHIEINLEAHYPCMALSYVAWWEVFPSEETR